MVDLLEEMLRVLREAGRSTKTANSYLSHLRRLKRSFGDRVANLTNVELQKYIEQLVDERKSLSYINQAQSAIRFLYISVLGKSDPLPSSSITLKKLPLHGIFSREEIVSILENTHDLKYRLALTLVYSSGLRVGETACLLKENVNVRKLIIIVNNRQGKILRDTILSREAADLFREYISTKPSESPFLFPGRGKSTCISSRTIQRAFAESLLITGITKHATLGWLRHSFAVHLLEDGFDRKLVRTLLGISTPSMMTPYMKLSVKRSHLRIISPLDRYKL